MSDEEETARAEPPDRRHEIGEAERSAFAVHRDPSLTEPDTQRRVGRGIAWVRPSNLIGSSTARLAGRGIDLQSDLARRARGAPGQAYRATRTQVREHRSRIAGRAGSARPIPEPSVFDSFDVLDPLTAPETRGRARLASWVRPSGIGLG